MRQGPAAIRHTRPHEALTMWGQILQAGLEVADRWMESSAQHKANRTNIKLQREQQKWEQMMSNTAVLRRRDDIIRAGGNPALAFTNGQEASTPSVSPAQVNPEWQGGATPNVTAMQMAKAQINNTNADTVEKLATARSKKIQADIDEAGAPSKTELTVNRNIEEHEQADLRTQMMRNLAATTAAQAKKNRETVDSMIAQAMQDAETGKLNLEALRNIASVGGIEAGKATPIIKLIIELLKD